jgi:hypothetical protein
MVTVICRYGQLGLTAGTMSTLDTRQLGIDLGLDTAGMSRTTLLGDMDPTTGAQLADTPLGMEAPAERPVSPKKWERMARDSLRPDPEVTPMGRRPQHRGWVCKAVGRPPLQNWSQRVWLYLQDDRLCWIREQDIGAATDTSCAPVATAGAVAATLGRVTLYPSAGHALGAGDAGHGAAARAAPGAAAAAETSASTVANIVNYIPLDRVPVRSTPRGYVPGTGVAAVSDSQIVPRERLGTAFAVTAGSHTHFFAAGTRAAAEAWLDAIRVEWLHCVMHTQRSTRTDRSELETLRLHEQAAQAGHARLQQEHRQVVMGLERRLGVLRRPDSTLSSVLFMLAPIPRSNHERDNE